MERYAKSGCEEHKIGSRPVTDTNLVRFRAAVAGALAHRSPAAQEVNDLNVFPVADGDTGDNMVLTLRAVLAELDRLQGSDTARDDRRDRARGDRAIRGPRAPCSARGELWRDPLPADPRRRRGARQPSRRADRPDARRRGPGPGGRPRLRVGARPRRGDHPDGRPRDGPPDHEPTSRTATTARGSGGRDRPRDPGPDDRPDARAWRDAGQEPSGAAPSCSPSCATPASSTPVRHTD